MGLSNRPSSVLRNRSTLVLSLLTLRLSTLLDSTASLLSGTLLVNSRLNLLIQLTLMLFLNLELLLTQRTTTMSLLVGMVSLRFGLF